jgi:hypothetical protein
MDKVRTQSEDVWAQVHNINAEMKDTWEAMRAAPLNSPEFAEAERRWNELSARKKPLYKRLEKLGDETPGSLVAKRFKAEQPALAVFDDQIFSDKATDKLRKKREKKWLSQLTKVVERSGVGGQFSEGKIIARVSPLRPQDEGRAFFHQGQVHLPENPTRRTFMHEVGHSIEEFSPRVRDAAQEFLRRRTEGEEAVSLRDLTGADYGRDEKTKKDKFIDPYMGKIYNHESTEIISMGVEYFMEQPHTLYEKDPDMFRFIARVLSGAI